MPAIIFFQHLKDTTHLCSASIVFDKRSAISFIISFFEGNVFLLWQLFSLYVIFKSFVMLSLVVISFSFFLFGVWLCLNSFTSSGLFLFIISSNMLLPLIFSPYSLYFQLHISQNFSPHSISHILFTCILYLLLSMLQLGHFLIFCLLTTNFLF